MLITFSSHRRWIIACLLILAVATASYIPYHRNAVNGPTGSSWPGLIYGVLGAALMLYAGLLGARRKVPTWQLGRATTWMKGHIWLGLLSVPLILFHSGFQLGGALTTILMVLIGLVVLSGLFGLVVQQILPRMMMTQVPMETIYEQIPHILGQLREEAEELVTAVSGPLENPSASVGVSERLQAGAEALESSPAPMEGSTPLRAVYLEDIQPFLQGSGREGPLATPARGIVVFQEMRTLLPPSLYKTLGELEAICEERRQLSLQTRLHYWLHGWLLVHVPLSMTLLLLSAVHAVIALSY